MELQKPMFFKVMHCDSTKVMWDKMISSYEGNEKVKDAKILTHRLKFEQLKMMKTKLSVSTSYV
jgi:hypothetical protein